MAVGALLFGVILAGIALYWTYVTDHRRVPAALPVTVASCTGFECNGDFGAEMQAYEDRLESVNSGFSGFSPWSAVDYCAIALDILARTPDGHRARWIPESFDRRGVLNIETTPEGVIVDRGPATASLWSTLFENRRVDGTRSCHMSDYGPLFSIWWFALIASVVALVLVRRSKGAA